MPLILSCMVNTDKKTERPQMVLFVAERGRQHKRSITAHMTGAGQKA